MTRIPCMLPVVSAQMKSYHQRLQACVGSSSSGHVLGGVVTQDVAHAGGGLAHQAGTQVDGVPKDCVLCPDAGPHTGAQQLPGRDSNAALPAYGLHTFYDRQCCLQGMTQVRFLHGSCAVACLWLCKSLHAGVGRVQCSRLHRGGCTSCLRGCMQLCCVTANRLSACTALSRSKEGTVHTVRAMPTSTDRLTPASSYIPPYTYI